MKTLNVKDTEYNESVIFKNNDIVILKSMRDFKDVGTSEILVDGFVMVLLKAGHATLNIEGETYKLSPGNIFICTPRNIIEDAMLSYDVEVTGFFSSSEYVSNIISQINVDVSRFAIAKSHDVVQLNLDEQKLFLSYIDNVSTLLNTPDFPHKRKAIESLLQSFALCTLDFSGLDDENDICDGKYTSSQLIFQRFLKLLGQSKGPIGNVNEFAQRLNITPKYLSTVCKTVSGYTASHLINDYIVKEAKIRLRDPNVSVKQVADRLGFANPSHFGTFIRRHTGMSPQALRETL